MVNNEAKVWGEVYEIAVKRGSIMALLDAKLLSASHPVVAEWNSKQIADVFQEMKEALYSDVINAAIHENIESYFQQLIKTGFGHGYTNTREFLRKIKPKGIARAKTANARPNWSLSGIWCPLTMPNDITQTIVDDYTTEEEHIAIKAFKEKALETWNQQFSLTHAKMFGKGMFGRADFLAVIKVKSNYHVLVQEYSLFYVLGEPEQFNAKDSCTYLQEYKRYIKHFESQSVFSYVNAEAQEIPFKFSKKLREYLRAYVRKEKVLFKMAQGCSYATTFVDSFKWKFEQDDMPNIRLSVMAITSRGSEYISAEFADKDKSPELEIMYQLGKEYQDNVLSLDDMDERTKLQVEILNYLVNEPVKNISEIVSKNISDISYGQDLTFTITERLKDFVNPNQPLALEWVFDLIDRQVDDEDHNQKLKEMVLAEFKTICKGKIENKTSFTLRDLHKCAVVLALKESKQGRVNFICLTGTPGIGKTSSVKTLLVDLEGFFFFYASPRVLINDDVVSDLSKISATITSNSDVVTQAQQIYSKIHNTDCKVNARGAAIVGGVEDMKIDHGSSVLLFKQDEYRKIKDLEQNANANRRYANTSESKITATNKKFARVFDSLGEATQQLLVFHPELNKLTMTVASQAFMPYNTTPAGPRNPRETQNKIVAASSLDGLEKMFQYKIDKKPTEAKIERREFAKKFPNIVVMFDEITGDSGTRTFINEMLKFLSKNFIEPFQGNSPFTVTVILADASLSNVNAIQNYMKKQDQLPAKMFISPSLGNFPFKMQTADLDDGNCVRSSIHIMANCYPASDLKIQYMLKQYAVVPETDDFGLDKNLTHLFRQKAGERTQQTAIELIQKNLEDGKKQVIYFAQDKNALAALRDALVDEGVVERSKIGIFDSQLIGYHRSELLDRKETLQVVLITSTAARGISFPNCDSIIAAMPRFAIEASLMEIAQLVYRGRGGYLDKEKNEWVNGDERDRLLTILVEDFYLVSNDETQTELEYKVKSSLDMLSIFMLIRGTLYTRITGDAGFKKTQIAMIPIGEVKDKASDKPGLASLIRDFMKEVNSVLYKIVATEGELVGRLKAVVEKAQTVYSANKLSSTYSTKTNKYRSFYTPTLTPELKELQFYEKWCRDHHSLKSRLLTISDQEDALTIPENIYICGPVIMEDRSNFGNKESFDIANDNFSQDSLRKFLNELIALQRGYLQLNAYKNIQKHIREITNMISSVLESETDSYTKEVEQQGMMRKLWVTYPVAANELVKLQDKSFDKDWFDALSFELRVRNAEFPVMAEYRDHPFRGTQQLSGHPVFERLFEQTNFMLCRELNLVNTLTMFNE